MIFKKKKAGVNKMDFKKMRTDLKLTQFDLTKEFGISINTYVKWEKGIATPSEKNQKIINNFLKKVGYNYEK